MDDILVGHCTPCPYGRAVAELQSLRCKKRFSLQLKFQNGHSMRVNGNEAVCTEAGKGQFDSWV